MTSCNYRENLESLMLQKFSLFPNNKQPNQQNKSKVTFSTPKMEACLLGGIFWGSNADSPALQLSSYAEDLQEMECVHRLVMKKVTFVFCDWTGRVVTDFSHSTQLPSENQNEVGGLEKINSINIFEMLWTAKGEYL